MRGYASLVAELLEEFLLDGELWASKAKRFYQALWWKLRVRNILTTFDEFTGNEILTERDVQDYQSMYIDLCNEFHKGADEDQENITMTWCLKWSLLSK